MTKSKLHMRLRITQTRIEVQLCDYKAKIVHNLSRHNFATFLFLRQNHSSIEQMSSRLSLTQKLATSRTLQGSGCHLRPEDMDFLTLRKRAILFLIWQGSRPASSKSVTCKYPTILSLSELIISSAQLNGSCPALDSFTRV